MRIGIRTKLVVFMIAVALVPLLLALAVIVFVGREWQQGSMGQGALSITEAEAKVMEAELDKDIEVLSIALQESTVLAQLSSANKIPMDVEKVKMMDRRWRNFDVGDKDVRRIFMSYASNVLSNVKHRNDHYVEILVTDAVGRLVAATDKTTDYYQADEEWWQKAYNDGKGQIYVPQVAYDESANVWGVAICVPIRDKGEIVGIVKGVIDLRLWLPECMRSVGMGQGFLYLLDKDGMVLHSRDIVESAEIPQLQLFEKWVTVQEMLKGDFWAIDESNAVISVAGIKLPNIIDGLNVKMGPWHLVMVVPENEARKGVARLSMFIMLLGLLAIMAIFLIGVLVIDRSLTNRIQRISKGARKVAKGDLQHRVSSKWAGSNALGKDEIDDLSHDFNNMVRRLEKSYNELTEANELKENFIRIAGHELRTPVSYIIGMSSLMKKSRDPERLAKAIDTMGFKATRLDEIIQAMFKLIPEHTLAEQISYDQVNVGRLLKEIEDNAQPWIERRHQHLSIVDETEGTVILADETKLRDVIENLLMNAIKFTPDEGWVKIVAQRRLGGLVAIQVIDQGPGIPEADQAHIFEPFFSGSDVLTHSTGKSGYGKKGMGLGLAIVKHFVDLHRGHIHFVTSPTGSTFTVELPIDPTVDHGTH